MALYYYTNGRPEEERSAGHSTLYRERPTERIQRTRKAVERVAPPILLDAAKQLSRRRRSKQQPG